MIPPIPDKKLSGTTDKSLLEKRMRGMELVL